MGRPTACATVEVTEAEVRGWKRIYENIYPLRPLAKSTFVTNLSFDLPPLPLRASNDAFQICYTPL